MQNVGGIQFDVIADTGQLLKAQQETDKAVNSITGSMRKMGASSAQVDKVTQSVDELGKTAKSSGNALSGMQRTLLGLATLTTAGSLAKMADDYRTLSERVRFATNSQEEYEKVQKRLAQSANESYRSLEEASEIFIGTSDNLRSLGFSLDESLDIADSLSFAFVKNATSAEQARNALRQYDVALNKGKVDMMGWQVINNAVPTLAKDIADSLGVTTQEVLNMGIASEITATMLNDALLKSFDSNKEAATGMATSIEDAFVKLRNNLSIFVGEANKTAGATDLVASAIDAVSENIEELATIMIAVGAGAIAKYVTQYGIMTVAKMKDALATRASAIAERDLAKKNLESAQAELARVSAISAKTAGSIAHKKALDAEAIAIANVDKAQKAMTASSRGFMALLGGPAGIVGLLATVGAGMAMFATTTHDTSEALEQLKQPLDTIIERFEKLNAEQKAQTLIEYDKARADLMKQEAQAADDIYGALHRMNVARYKSNQADSIAIYQMHEYRKAIQNVVAEGGDIIDTIKQIATETNMSAADTKAFIDAAAGYTGLRDQVIEAGKAYDILSNSVNGAKNAVDGLTEAQRIQNTVNETASSELEKLAKSFQDSANNAKYGGSAVKQAERKIAELREGVTEFNETLAEQIMTNAKYIDGMKQTRSETNSNVQVLRDLQRELELANLSGKELAITQAESRLTEFATQTEVQAVRDLAGALYDLNEVKKFGQTKEEQDKYFTGADPLTGGEFDSQAERYEDELAKEIQRYNEKLAEFALFRDQKLRTEEEYNDLEYAMQQQHDQRMGRIEKAKNQAVLKSYEGSFMAIADVMRTAQGEQSKAYKAMFAVAKSFAIADATMNAYDAISKAWASAPFPANLAAVAATTPAVMGVLSSIQGINYGGGRQYGGGVVDDKMYQVNETGQPEIFNAAGGKQYFLPNTRGEVIPADKAFGQGQGGGASKVTVNLIEDSSRGGTIEDQSTSEETILDVFVANIYSGGIASQAIEGTYGLTRKGR